ncbi:hypothetical protein GCM10018787_49840 [Streptomyces thermodiastaticus]|nr:hypothetical protein GCM10018787_49840 [Streptomyces thermodiastaticus]
MTVVLWYGCPWNHSWHQAHTHDSAGIAFPHQTTKWTRTQQRTWTQLHPHQQHLLSTIGIHGPTPLHRYNSHPANPTDQPAEPINTYETNPEQETRSSQAHPGPARKQRQAPHHHTPHRQTQPAN